VQELSIYDDGSRREPPGHHQYCGYPAVIQARCRGQMSPITQQTACCDSSEWWDLTRQWTSEGNDRWASSKSRPILTRKPSLVDLAREDELNVRVGEQPAS
jgi:hypothetical protein